MRRAAGQTAEVYGWGAGASALIAGWTDAHQAMADDLFAVVGSGAVKIRIDQRYPLADVAQAHRDLEARKTTGSTVLMP